MKGKEKVRQHCPPGHGPEQRPEPPPACVTSEPPFAWAWAQLLPGGGGWLFTQGDIAQRSFVVALLGAGEIRVPCLLSKPRTTQAGETGKQGDTVSTARGCRARGAGGIAASTRSRGGSGEQ